MIGKKINQLATELAPASTDLTIIGDPISGVSKKITIAQLGAIFSGAVSFYDNFAAFPATGDINVIYCAKDTKKLYLWSGTAYVEVFPSQALLDTYQLRSEKGNANGYASLDSGGKVPISQLPSSIMEYKGTWNASTNTPTLANGTGDTGDVYICNVAGTVDFGAGPLTFAVGDYVIYSGTIWQRSSGAVGTVTSVALTVGGDAISVSGSPLTTSGTLGLTFNGTTAQYIRGNGILETFPSLTGFVPYTGATANVNLGTNNITAQNNILNGNGTDTGSYLAFKQYSGSNSGADGYTSLYALAQNSLYIRYSQTDLSQKNVDLSAALLGTTTRQYLFPDKNGTFAMVSDLTGGTVTSVAALTIGTSGTDLSSTVANGTTTPVITLNVPTASATNRGALSSEDWASFNSKQNAITLTTTGTSGAATLVGATLNIPNYTSGLTGYVPYTGATANLDLGTFTLLAANGTFSSSGSGDTVGITHLSGSGIALNITKGGNGEGLYINKTSGSGNAATIIGTLNATTLVKSGGTSAQFLKADGSVDSTSYGTGSVTSVGLSSATSGVTIGSTPITTSGTITLAIATASGSQQGLLSSTDWTTFNNKQSALTNPVTGTGTTNYLPKFTGASTIGNSIISESGTIITVAGSSRFTGFDSGYYNENVLAIGNGTNNPKIGLASTSGYRWNTRIKDVGGNGEYVIRYEEGSLDALIINRSGNLGLGVTPSAWGTQNTVLQLLNNTSLISRSGFTALARNLFYTTSDVAAYISNGVATNYLQISGEHRWLNAVSGTAGATMTQTQAMTLDASGRLIVGATSPIYLKFNVAETSTNRVAILYRGTQGADTNMVTTFGTPYLSIGGQENKVDSIQTIGFGFTNGTTYIQPAEIGFQTTSLSGYTLGDLVFATRSATTNTAPDVRLRIASTGAATFSSSVTAAELYLSTSNGLVGNINSSNANGGYLTWQTSGAVIADIGTTQQIFGSGGNDTFGINGRGARAIAFGTNNTERMRITSVGNVEINTGSIKTGEPDTGYGRAAIKIGARNTGQAFNSGGHLPVNIDGTIYFINVYSSLP
jgi:hypothetical protein